MVFSVLIVIWKSLKLWCYLLVFWEVFALAEIRLKLRVTADDILRALNTGDRFGEKYFLRALRDSARLPPAPMSRYVQATEIHRKRLRRLVDAWIETGISAAGTESPGRRGFNSLPNGEPAPRTREINTPVSEEEYTALTVRAAKYGKTAEELVQDLADYWIAEKFPCDAPVVFASFIFTATQTHEIITVPVGAKFEFEFAGASGATNDHPIGAALRHADRLFCALMLADWNTSICKCRRCGKYLQKLPPLALYKRGTHCRSCSSNASAQRRTDQKRQDCKRRLLLVAAAALQEWKRTPPGRLTMKDWIARHVNRELGAQDQTITSKWVSRNLKKIEAETNS
jgi:hypothetical protein